MRMNILGGLITLGFVLILVVIVLTARHFLGDDSIIAGFCGAYGRALAGIWFPEYVK